MKKLIIALIFIAPAVIAQSTNDRPVYYDGATMYSKQTGTWQPLTNINASVYVTNDFGWEDLRFPASSAAKLNPSADIVVNVPENAVDYKTSTDTNITDEHVYFVAQIPHAWREGSDLSPHVHFIQENVDHTNMWYMWYRWYSIGGTNTEAWTFIGPATNMAAYTAGAVHQMAVFSLVDGIGQEESSIMDIKLMRDGNFGTGTVMLKEFDIHYQVQKPTGEKGIPID